MRPYLFLLALPALSAALPFHLNLEPRADDDTGCNMNAGSDLMQCLGSWASIPPMPSATGAIGVEAASLCEQYNQIAACWGNGTYCREWLPVKTAADKLCALAASASSASSTASSTSSAVVSSASSANATATSTLPSSVSEISATAVASEIFSSVVGEASNVITSIWNNDSGTDIPSISNDVGTQTEPTWTAEKSGGSAVAPGDSAAASSGGSD
ncbi:hypothetical protein JCM10213_001877 [Rhodosporidiobolus nylandii]